MLTISHSELNCFPSAQRCSLCVILFFGSFFFSAFNFSLYSISPGLCSPWLSIPFFFLLFCRLNQERPHLCWRLNEYLQQRRRCFLTGSVILKVRLTSLVLTWTQTGERMQIIIKVCLTMYKLRQIHMQRSTFACAPIYTLSHAEGCLAFPQLQAVSLLAQLFFRPCS